MNHPVMRQVFPSVRYETPGMSEIYDEKRYETQYVQFINLILFRLYSSPMESNKPPCIPIVECIYSFKSNIADPVIFLV